MEAETRRKAAEEAQKRTLEQMKQMASRYSDADDGATAAIVRTKDDAPLADGLVGAAFEESFEKSVVKLNEVQQALLAKAVKKAAKVSKKSVK